MRHLEPDPNGPDFLGFQRRLRSNQLATILWCGGSAGMISDNVLHCSAPEAKPPTTMNLGRYANKTQTEYSSQSLRQLTRVSRTSHPLLLSPAHDPERTFLRCEGSKPHHVDFLASDKEGIVLAFGSAGAALQPAAKYVGSDRCRTADHASEITPRCVRSAAHRRYTRHPSARTGCAPHH